jgi:hypothetical protein
MQKPNVFEGYFSSGTESAFWPLSSRLSTEGLKCKNPMIYTANSVPEPNNSVPEPN